MKNDELMHYGRKGMKWYQRIYQNKDGSLNDRGQRRYDKDVRTNNAKKKDNRNKIDGPDPDRWVKEDLTSVKKTVDASKNLNRELSDIERNTRVKSVRKNVDLSSMSDQELRSYINRANLERQYTELLAYDQAQNVSRGRRAVENTLEYGDRVLAVGASALTIALALHELTS